MKKGNFKVAGEQTTTIRKLPCKLDYSGTARVEEFLPIQEEVSFHGRKLVGQTIPVPEGFTGRVVVCDSNTLLADSVFDKVTYWNEDMPASETDQLPQIFSYSSVISSMHSA